MAGGRADSGAMAGGRGAGEVPAEDGGAGGGNPRRRGRGFPRFPHAAPYATQRGVMDAVYEAAALGGGSGRRSVGVVESPTGTGKTLALLCGALLL